MSSPGPFWWRLALMCLSTCLMAGLAALGQQDSFAANPASGGAWSLDGRRLLLAACESKTPSLWDLSTGKVIQTFRGHTEPVWVVAFSPDGTRVATGAAANSMTFQVSTDNSVRLWDIASGKEAGRFVYIAQNLAERYRFVPLVRSVEFSRDGKRLLTLDGWGARVWDIATGRELFVLDDTTPAPPFRLHESPRDNNVSSASLSPDMRTILIREKDRVRLFDYMTGAERCTIVSTHMNFFQDAGFSPDARRIVTAAPGAEQVWDSADCKETRALAVTTTTFSHASFAPDGRSIVTNLAGPASAQLWDAQSGQVIRQFAPSGADYVLDAVLSLDGKRLLTRSVFMRRGIGESRFTSLWDVESGQELHRFDEGQFRLFVVGFSPDSKTIPVTDGARPISLWSAETGGLIRQY